MPIVVIIRTYGVYALKSILCRTMIAEVDGMQLARSAFCLPSTTLRGKGRQKADPHLQDGVDKWAR